MNITYHQGLTTEKWFGMSIFEQMANVGSEIYRTISWREKNADDSKEAFYRGLELLDLTIMDAKNKMRLKELLRTREALVDHFVYDNGYQTTDEQWQNYFYSFNYAARNKYTSV
jgi:hypothetical protein